MQRMYPNLFYPEQRQTEENWEREGCQQPAEECPQMLHRNKNDFTVNTRHLSESTHGKSPLLLKAKVG